MFQTVGTGCDNNTPVKFNVKADMGPIHLDNGAGGTIKTV